MSSLTDFPTETPPTGNAVSTTQNSDTGNSHTIAADATHPEHFHPDLLVPATSDDEADRNITIDHTIDTDSILEDGGALHVIENGARVSYEIPECDPSTQVFERHPLQDTLIALSCMRQSLAKRHKNIIERNPIPRLVEVDAKFRFNSKCSLTNTRCLAALAIFMCGEHTEECSRCASPHSKPPFQVCFSRPEEESGACANCLFKGQALNCSLRNPESD